MYKISLKILDWLKKQIQIESKNTNTPRIHEREIWWCSIGYNVGYEELGKGEHFQRPVLIIKKFSNNFFLGVLLSTKLKEDNKYYKQISFQGETISAMISQIRSFDSKRLTEKMGTLDDVDFTKVKTSVLDMIQNSP